MFDISHLTKAEKKEILDRVNKPSVDTDVMMDLVVNDGLGINELIHWSMCKERAFHELNVEEPKFARENFLAIISRVTEEEKREEFSVQLQKIIPDEVKRAIVNRNKSNKGLKMSTKKVNIKENKPFDNEALMVIVGKIQNLQSTLEDAKADLREVWSECASAGFDTKYVKKAIKALRTDPDKLMEDMELTKLYYKGCGVQLTFDL